MLIDNIPQSTQRYVVLLKENHNIVLHGAPGTGKTYLAQKIADQMGAQWEMAQFHPSYDYTDFVEGLRPVNGDESGNIGFRRMDGVFKSFCKKALRNWVDSAKSQAEIQREASLQEQVETFLTSCVEEEREMQLTTGNRFSITEFDDEHIRVNSPDNKKVTELTLSMAELMKILATDNDISAVKDVKECLGQKFGTQQNSYIFILYKEIKAMKGQVPVIVANAVPRKNFVFIIDEINRGDLSKIFGELFFSIDPGYRGEKGKVQTQYQNIVEDGDLFKNGFYIPENVYIIGTMNDIDRSVESMDFAMRRRFTFCEITADESAENFPLDDSTKELMSRLNNAIAATDGLGRDYQIGAAYFKNLKSPENCGG
ncbi:MAG: AAA family ATPase [Bacteroidales bacterium]|nr:AAA family ATPase [Bacteroidales bacterium]